MTNNTLIRELETAPVASPEKLATYADAMQTQAADFAATRLVYNLYALYESLYDADAVDACEPTKEAAKNAETLLLELLNGPEADLSDRLLALREDNKERMTLLDEYKEQLNADVYVLNRVEYRFHEKHLPAGYSDDDTTDLYMQILAQLPKEERGEYLSQMIEQLPMRITKARVLQNIADHLDLYKGSEKKNVRSNIYLIRSKALLTAPRGAAKYPVFEELTKKLRSTDWKTATISDFDELHAAVEPVIMTLGSEQGIGTILEDVIGDAAVLSITGILPKEDMRALLLEMLENHGQVENEEEKLSRYVGRQEASHESFLRFSSSLEEIADSCMNEIAAAGMQETFRNLEIIDRLLSESRFADLTEDDPSDFEAADPFWIQEETTKLLNELDAQIKKLPKSYARCVMASLIAIHPTFIHSVEDIDQYIRMSLTACSDEAEKISCLELLDGLFGQSSAAAE